MSTYFASYRDQIPNEKLEFQNNTSFADNTDKKIMPGNHFVVHFGLDCGIDTSRNTLSRGSVSAEFDVSIPVAPGLSSYDSLHAKRLHSTERSEFQKCRKIFLRDWIGNGVWLTMTNSHSSPKRIVKVGSHLEPDPAVHRPHHWRPVQEVPGATFTQDISCHIIQVGWYTNMVAKRYNWRSLWSTIPQRTIMEVPWKFLQEFFKPILEAFYQNCIVL